MTHQVGALFDLVADDYDQSGVAFFGPIAQRLVDALDPRPGERCLDVGCGRGAVSRVLVERVGSAGAVLGIDVSAEMVRLAATDVPDARFEVGDAMSPGPEDAAWDLIAASCVLFFLPDPVAALRGWWARLAPGGRVGVSTFGPIDPRLEGVDELLRQHTPDRDQQTREALAHLRTDEGVADSLAQAGFAEVTTTRDKLPIVFADADHWFAFSMSTGQRALWLRVPEPERPAVRAACEQRLEAARRTDGAFEVWQDVRVTTGRRPQ